MGVLWESGAECTVRAVADALEPHAYTTVATVLERLVHKGLVARRKDGRRILYAGKGSGALHGALVARRALDSSAEPEATLTALVDLLSESERAALRRGLERR
jgi:predicted transcriptional regulator